MLRELCKEGEKHTIVPDATLYKDRELARLAMSALHVGFMRTKYIKIKDETSLIMGAYPLSELANWNKGAQQALINIPEIKSVNIIVFNENTNKYIGGCRVERGVDCE